MVTSQCWLRGQTWGSWEAFPTQLIQCNTPRGSSGTALQTACPREKQCKHLFLTAIQPGNRKRTAFLERSHSFSSASLWAWGSTGWWRTDRQVYWDLHRASTTCPLTRNFKKWIIINSASSTCCLKSTQQIFYLSWMSVAQMCTLWECQLL